MSLGESGGFDMSGKNILCPEMINRCVVVPWLKDLTRRLGSLPGLQHPKLGSHWVRWSLQARSVPALLIPLIQQQALSIWEGFQDVTQKSSFGFFNSVALTGQSSEKKILKGFHFGLWGKKKKSMCAKVSEWFALDTPLKMMLSLSSSVKHLYDSV